MSSATSIDPASPAEKPAADNTFTASHFFIMASLLLATGAVVVARQTTPSNLVLISLAIGAAGAAAAGLYRTLAPLVTPDASVWRDRPTERVRDALQREKTLVLRAIKDLEFDRAMGKVSDRDFDEMAGRLRGRAINLMRQLDSDSGGFREMVERDLRARLKEKTRASAPPAVPDGSCSCGTVNDADATFCKRCGNRLVSA